MFTEDRKTASCHPIYVFHFKSGTKVGLMREELGGKSATVRKAKRK